MFAAGGEEEEDRIVSPLDTSLSRETREAEGVAVGLSTALSGLTLEPNQCSRPLRLRMPTRGGYLIHCSVRTGGEGAILHHYYP